MNTNDIPNYVKLFGDIDFREADEARSVYSPAAYLADLLQLIDDQFDDPPSDLDQRRTDIKEILLNSENTFTLLPYLDIVNEVLEKKVKGSSTKDAYDMLRLANYPFNLPFDLGHERIALYEKYLGITPEELHKLFAQAYNKDVVAREYLGLSEEATTIVTETAGDMLGARYGDRLSDIRKTMSTPVDAFLDVTGLTHLELRELLVGNLDASELAGKRQSEFFCNFELDGWATYDATEENIVWLSSPQVDIPEQWFDRAQRLIRLSRITGLSISDINLIIRSCCDNILNKESLKRIAVVKNLNTTFALKIDETCALFSAMSDMGHGDEDLPTDLFNRVFNGSFASLAKTYVGTPLYWPDPLDQFTKLEYSGDILTLENKTYRNRIAQGLKISEKQLQVAIRGFRSRANEDIEDEDNLDSLWTKQNEEMSMLSALYRVSKLVDVLETSFEDLFMLLDILERDPAVRRFANSGVFIDFSVTERNCYKILRQGSTEELLWLVQLLYSLNKWLFENDLTAEELLKISTGRYRRNLKEVTALTDKKQPSAKALATKEKIALLNNLYGQLKPWLLDETSFVSSTFDQRFARIIHTVITQSNLVAKADARLVRSNEKALMEAAQEAIDRFDRLTKVDFLGLGLEEKIADKIFSNLILMGYLTTEGILNEAMIPESVATFGLETDFTYLQEALFKAIQTLYEGYIDVAIYPSDLESLGLSKLHLDELYDNLIFNGFLSEDGTLLQGATLSSIDNLDLFEVNSGIGEYANEAYALLYKAVEKFKKTKIRIDKGIFSDLSLTEGELEDLVENLRFNEYIDEEDVLVDNTALLQVEAEDLLLELRFYPHRHKILTALQLHIERHKSQFYTVKKELFFDIADRLVADWAFEAISSEYLQDGRIQEQDRDYFKDLENVASLDIAWPFEPNQNRVVFERIRSIILAADQYRLTNAPFEAFKFNEAEIDELISVLTATGYLTVDRKIPADKVQYFLNINNALEFTVQAFEDYSKDVFFMLHEIAKRVDKSTQEIATLHKGLEVGQENTLYQSLQDAFGLPAESIAAISKQVFMGSANVREEWLLPILATVNIHDEIDREPDSSRFNTAYRRIQQSALLAAKLKLDRDEIEIAFHDQSLVEKYPESIELPAMTKVDGSRVQITSFDALLESTDGRIYLFKSAEPANDTDYARYWVYSSATHELIETEDNRLSTLLSGDKESTLNFSRVDAAFVDKQGNDVLIADGKYYVKKQTKDGPVWQIHEREWGHVDSDFENLQVIDAAFTDESDRTYLFSNDQYVRYSAGLAYVDDGYPKNVVDSWADEGKNQSLPEEFQTSLDGAFYGTDHKTYFFKDGRFIDADKPDVIQATRDVWGKVKNNLKASQRVDAFYGDGSHYFVLSGDQVFAYRDCLENDGVMIQEGFPKLLTDHFGPGLPGEFHAGVDAAFKGEDGSVHLFKGEKSVAIGDAPAAIVKTKERWGVIDNTLATSGKVDAALAGLDGRIYLFSGDQYFRYASRDYSEVDSGYPRDVSDDWGGLTAINAAFVLDGKTYLFGTGEVEQADGSMAVKKAYVRYSTNDYEQPDDGYPKEQTETDDFWWNLPEAIKSSPDFTEVDAVFNAPNGRTFLFSGEKFIYFDRVHGWWSEPSTLGEMWEAMPFASIDAAFCGKDGKTYFFSGDEYVRFSGDDYSQLDNGYPRPTNRLWGNVKNNLAERGTIDAALVVESREAEEQEDGSLKTVKTMHTYLFSGDQFFRYKNADYARVEPGYPKAIGLLKDEPRFKNLDVMLDGGIDAAFSDRRSVYLLKGSTIHVVSDEPSAKHLGSDNNAFVGIGCAFLDQGGVYVEKDSDWYHISSLESRDSSLADQGIALTPETPPLLTDVPDNYKIGLSAVLRGTDTNAYLFKGNAFFNQGLNRAFPIADQWGRVRNNIQDRNAIDAGFVGRDGKTYVFSGDQYVVYEGDTYLGQEVFEESEDTLAVKPIADNWGGLTSVRVAYVRRDQTYLFEKPDAAGNFRYVRYSSTDYERPDSGFPQVVDVGFWQIPSGYQAQGWDSFKAIVIGSDDTMLFIKGQEFLQFNAASEYWSPPKSLDMLWNGTYQDDRLFDNLQAVFIGADGTAYFFGDECYVTHKDGVFTQRKRIGDEWGLLPTQFKDKIDAAFVYRDTVTYLFAGDKYVRYSGPDYDTIDDGYPKSITKDLRQEHGFENLPPEFEVRAGELNSGPDAVIINAVVANHRHIYLFMGNDCYVSSSRKTGTYGIDILGSQRNRICETGEIDAAFVSGEETYLFSGDQYVRYSESNYDYVDAGYPKRIATGLASDLSTGTGLVNIPTQFHSGIDAAVSKNGTVYLFKDDKFFDFDAMNPIAKDVELTWGKTKNNFVPTTTDTSIDGAFVDSRGRLYAFKGDQFIRYADTDQDYVETGYPKRIAATFQAPDSFEIENSIDGAFTFEGRTYLVKGDEYVCYSGEDYGCLPSFYPVKFIDRWGDWSDYRLEDIKLITRFKSLQNSYGGDYTLVDFLRINQGYVKHPYAMLADIFNWDIEEVKWLKRNNAFLPPAAADEMQFNLELICRMFDILSLTNKMAAGAKSVYEDIWQKRYDANPNLAEAANALLELLGVKNGNSPDWQVLVDEVHNKLNLLKRDALVPYTIFIDGEINDARDLYEQLLIDIQMGESAQISRIKEAISAVQLYFHRYFINLENVGLRGANDDIQKQVLKKRWNWMRNYRVWEANRKVFLYPENYIRPELRDTKTPEFKTLEENLLQGELTEANITRAFNHYIDRYIEVSRLTIAGGYVYDSIADEDDKQIILFGHTKSEPHQYYYRTATFVNGRSDSVVWQPWLAVNVQIDADRVYPVYTLNKIFVFWAKVEIRSNVGPDSNFNLKGDVNSGFKSETDVVNESVLQVYYSYFNLNGEWAPPQKIQYEIASNDTITEFSLDFSGVKETADNDLDNIQVSCHYTTEREIKLETDSAGKVAVTELEKIYNQTIYLKASNPRKAYYIDDDRSSGQAMAKLILPGDVLNEGTQFKIVPTKNLILPLFLEPSISPLYFYFLFLSSLISNAISFESVIKPGYYLRWDRWDGSKAQVRLSPSSGPWWERYNLITQSSFIVTKGLIGDGYSFEPLFAPKTILYYQETDQYESDVQIKAWSALKTHTAQRQATFSFISHREEKSSTLRFYPETNLANEESLQVPPSRSGIDRFKALFPDENAAQVGRPVLLNVPIDQHSLSWICFDYKGGSFLCKPTSGQANDQGEETKDALAHLPANFIPISAAFHAGGNTYYFSTDGHYLIDGEDSIEQTTHICGEVNNKIQSDGQVDSALVRLQDGKTFLFRADQYVVYTHEYDYVDESYPRQLAGNTDDLPELDRIDASFQVGETSYFVSGKEYVTSNDFTKKLKISRLWKQWSPSASEIRGVFTHGPTTYSTYISNDGRRGWFKETSKDDDLKARLDQLYPKPPRVSDIPLAHVTAAFNIGTSVYMKIEDGSVKYMRYEGGSSKPVFKHLNAAAKMKAVFVEGNHFYILRDPEDNTPPVIRRWDKTDLSAKLTDIKITGTPDGDVDTFFYDSKTKKTYLLSLRRDEYMILDGLPGGSSGPIKWKKEGDIAKYIASLKVVTPISKIDAGFNKDGKLFLISGNQYSRFTLLERTDPNPGDSPLELPADPDEGYPRLLGEANPDELPPWDRIDAAFQGPDGIVRFFKGKQYSDSSKIEISEGQASFPLSQIKNDWGKVRNNIYDTGRVDAAFTIGNQVYLISGDQYYRYTTLNPPTLEEGYPKKLASNTEGLPTWEGDSVASAFEMGGKVYIFSKGVAYAEYDPETKQSTEARIATNWQWPEAYQDFDAAYSEDGHLYLIKGVNRRKYLNPTTDLVQRGNAKYDIIRLSSMTGSQLSQALFRGGIDGLMRRSNQEIDELPKFTFDKEETGNAIIQVSKDRVSYENFPVNSHLEFQGANGLYYWELFYHAPTLIAQSLNTAQKFEEANQWYEYIFDPTAGSHFWKFLPFLAVDIDGLIAVIKPWAEHNITRASASRLIAKLMPFAPALAGQESMSDKPEDNDSKAKFEELRQFDPEKGIFQTWPEVANLEMQLTALEAKGYRLILSSREADIPESGVSLVVLAKLPDNKYHARFFDAKGSMVLDLGGDEFLPDEKFKQELNEAFSQEQIPNETISKLLQTITSPADSIAETKETIELIKRLPVRYALMTRNGLEQIKAYLDDPFDPHAIAALRRIAYRRTTVMAYIDNLLDWGDMLFRQYTHESINEARMLYILAYDLLGKKPSSLGTKVLSEAIPYAEMEETGAEVDKNAYDFLFDVSADNIEERSLTHAGTVHESVGNPYFYIPENDQILGYWGRVEDRLFKIRHSLNIMGVEQPLPLFQPPIDPMAIVSAVAGGGGVSAALAGLQVTVPHYRFTFMLNKARELVGKLSQFGNELLGAIEKKDAEELSLLQNRQELVILQMTRAIREAQLRESQETLNYLETSKTGAETQKTHYADLLRKEKLDEEHLQIDLMRAAGTTFALVPILKIVAAVVKAIPNIKIGSPFSMGATTGGSTIGASLGFIAESGEAVAESLSMFGEAAGMEAQYIRSRQDWDLQEKIATSEIAQLEYQIEGAKWQIRAAEQELANIEKEADHNLSINTFMREKFSNQQLYQWMAGKLSALYFQTYKMAHDMAKAAEMAYRFERGVPESQVNFIGGNYWDSLKKGLLAGDSLDLDLDRMEKAYLETHVRSFEITKTISLVELDPIAFLNLKNKGVCEFHFTEELLDYDFPGHYRRQVKTIAVKLNAGEGKTVNATLTQLRNKTIMEADTKAVKYLLNPKDSQPLTIRNDWRPNQQIAVSQIDPYTENSMGMFDLRFDDDRYLPFEGTGAVSSWRLELSGKRGSYNISDLADVEIELKYTALQGGQVFADAVKGMLKPYPAAVYIDMAQTFPNEFFAFVYDETETLEINITRDMFPNMSGSKITGIYSFFEMNEGGQITLVMNDDSALTLRSNKLLLTDSLVVGARGETWTFKAKGKKSDLVNIGLVFTYKARVA